MEAGLTERVAGLVVTPFCVNPSDQVKFHGLVPVSAAEIVAEPPVQMLVLPLTAAVGAMTETMLVDLKHVTN